MSRRSVDDAGTSTAAVEYTSFFDMKTRTVGTDVLGYGACRKVNEFEKLNRIGEGTYGIVYRAKDTVSGQIVALKKVRVDDRVEGISESALREILLLSTLRHENIVFMREVAVARDVRSMFLVMEYCDSDLAAVLDHLTMPFTEPQVKCILQQLLRGLDYLHRNYVIHRDLKVTNLLLTADGILKIADFGLARTFGDPSVDMTPKVVTLWYRAPELLFGSKRQTCGVDMWAVGCIMGELLLHRPLMPGKGELEQINKIISLLGTPTTRLWPELDEMPALKDFTLMEQPYNNLKTVIECASVAGIELLNALFVYNPALRISAKDAIAHAYFEEYPFPCAPALMPTYSPHTPLRDLKRKRPPS